MTTNSLNLGLSRRRFLAVGAAAAAGALAGCGGGQSAEEAAGGPAAPSATGTFSGTYEGPAVTLTYWNGFTGGDGPFMQQMLKDFQAANPNISIKNNTVEWAQFYQRMPAAVTANQGPDVGVMHMDQLATNAVRQIIVPVDDLAQAIGLTETNFTEEVWSAGEYEGNRYGIPLDVHSLAMYYDTEAFEKAGVSEAPTDEQSFVAALDALQSAGYNTPFWMPTRWPAHLMFLSLLWQNGGQPYAEDGSEAMFASEAGVNALSWMRSMIEQGYSPRDVAQDSQYIAFKNRENPVTWDGIWQINDLKAANMPFGIAPIPTIGDQSAVWANSHNFFITRQAAQDANKLQAARVFVNWMSEQSAEWAGAGMIPALKDVRESAAVQETTQAPVVAQIDEMHFLPPVPGLGDVQAQTLEVAVAEALLLKQEPAAALEQAAERATKLMQENLEKFGG